MKTQYELRFEELVIAMILNDTTSTEEKTSSLYQFHQSSRIYYDSLCDGLYLLSIGRSDSSLWLTHAGEPKLLHPDETIEGHLVFDSSDIPSFHEDLIGQIEFAFRRMSRIIKGLKTQNNS